MKRLVVVSTEFPPGPGGIGTHAHRLTLGLAARGWDPVVLTSQDYASAEEIQAFDAAAPFRIVPFRRVPGPPLEALLRARELRRWLRRHRPDAILASGSRAVMLAAGCVGGTGHPWIAVGHGTEFGARGGWEAKAVRAAFGRASAVVCVSEFTRGRMRAAGVRARREFVIPNGADGGRFRRIAADEATAARLDLGLERARLLMTVGNVTERKGQDLVVRALPEILRQEPETHYLVAGLPTRGAELQNLAKSLGVGDRVHLLGRVEASRLVALLNASDVFVMASRATAGGDVEGYGIAVVEAALCGLPAVVTGGSGLAEAVRDGETGLVVPPEDPGALAGAIRSLLADATRRNAMAERARHRAEQEQTWEQCAAAYDAALDAVLRGHAAPADGWRAVL